MYDWVPKDQVVWLVIDTVEQLATPELTARLAGGTRKTARGRDKRLLDRGMGHRPERHHQPGFAWYGSDDGFVPHGQVRGRQDLGGQGVPATCPNGGATADIFVIGYAAP